MKVYLLTTGAVFGVLVLAHLWRIIEGETHLVKDPWFVLSTVLATALFVWAIRLLRRVPPLTR